MFYHEDGIPNEDAFERHLVSMKDGDKIAIPDGMRKQDALLCIGTAETKTHVCFEVRKRMVYAKEDPYVTILFNLPEPYEGRVPEGKRIFFSRAIIKVQKKRRSVFKMNGDLITVGI